MGRDEDVGSEGWMKIDRETERERERRIAAVSEKRDRSELLTYGETEGGEGEKEVPGQGRVEKKKVHTRASRERCNRLQCFSTAREQSVLRVDGGE